MKEKTPKYFTAYDRLKDVKTLIKEYTNSLGIDLSFQSFEKEMFEYLSLRKAPHCDESRPAF